LYYRYEQFTNLYVRIFVKMGMLSSLYFALLLSVQFFEAPCEPQNSTTNVSSSFSLRGLLYRWFPPISPKVSLLNSVSPIGISSSTIRTIEDGDIVSQSTISDVSNIYVQVRALSLASSVRMNYAFREDINSALPTKIFEAVDTSRPYMLLDGSTGNIPDLLMVGYHSVVITATGWFGLQMGPSVTVRWIVSDDTAPIPGPTVATSPTPAARVEVVGELRVWHKITLVFRDGPFTSETATPNPFTDYRLDVVFRSSTEVVVMTVAAYYAADGNAADTSANSGGVWHCHFAPPTVGTWKWQASFRIGTNIAMASPGNVTGTAVRPIDGAFGSFDVLPSNKTGVDLRGKGLLQYIPGKHHLQFAGTGEWFLKAGADSPENFLAYEDFDNTPDIGGRRKSWSPHVRDYVIGEPTWSGGKGKGIIGAINYLSAQGMRAVSFLTMNIGGDDENVYPYIGSTWRLRFDVSKLAQWEIVFEHANTKGMFLHFKTQETENDQLLDFGALGNERKLYYRELIARFGHHLALNWNIGEESTNTVVQRKAFADWFKALDPYKHPVVIHTYPDEQSLVYGPLYGYPSYDGSSLQSDATDVFRDTLARVKESAASGRTWVVSNDEQGTAETGVVPDTVDPNHDNIRREVLWGNLMVIYWQNNLNFE
jgi:Domain of unknown function (DUF5060)